MKKTLTVLALATAFSTPVFAAPSVDVLVPVEPTTEEVITAKKEILAASKKVCRKAVAPTSSPIFYKAELENCVELTFEQAMEDAVEKNLAALAEDTTVTVN